VITYRCDRCGFETTPDKLYEVEVIFTPHSLDDGGLDTDKEDRKTLGDLCADCTDRIEPLAQAFVKPERVVSAMPPRAKDDEIARQVAASPSDLVSWGDTREKAD
jgi:hypothetical protein